MSNKKIKISKSKAKFSLTRIVVFVILCTIVLGVGFGFKQDIERLLNKQVYSSTETIDDNGLTTYFIDVGQGDSIAIRFPDGKTMLVDAGPKTHTDKLINYLKNNFFNAGESTFDYLLLTHSDLDHCGGMARVCEEFTINKIYRPYIYSKYSKNEINFDETNGDETNKTTCTTKAYYETITAFNNETSNIVFTDIGVCNASEKIEGEGYSIDFFYPTKNYISSSDVAGVGTVFNNYSPIMVLNYNGKKIMLTGDVSTTAEQMAINNQTLPDVDILKVAHHGSATSTSSAFLSQTKPEHSVICVGEGNSYDHPTDEALNRLISCGSSIYRTDLNGNVVANITSEEVASINIFFDTVYSVVYIRVEYIMGGILLLGLYFCFGIKAKAK